MNGKEIYETVSVKFVTTLIHIEQINDKLGNENFIDI